MKVEEAYPMYPRTAAYVVCTHYKSTEPTGKSNGFDELTHFYAIYWLIYTDPCRKQQMILYHHKISFKEEESSLVETIDNVDNTESTMCDLSVLVVLL